LGEVISQKDKPDKTGSPRNLMGLGISTSLAAPFVPQETEENVYSEVTTLSVLNNSGFTAASAEQDSLYEDYYYVPGR
jgi:hypothetical protein